MLQGRRHGFEDFNNSSVKYNAYLSTEEVLLGGMQGDDNMQVGGLPPVSDAQLRRQVPQSER